MQNTDIQNSLINLFGESFCHNDLIAFKYGSGEHDIDLCVVVPDPRGITVIQIGQLDLFICDHSSFFLMYSHKDPQVTEAILHGDLLFGDKSWIESLKDEIKSREFTNEDFIYLLGKSREAFMNATQWLQNGHKPYDYLVAGKNISYAISLTVFAEHYKESGGLVSFKELCKKHSFTGKDILISYLNHKRNSDYLKEQLPIWISQLKNEFSHFSTAK